MKLFKLLLLPLLILATLPSCAQKNGKQIAKEPKLTENQLQQYTKATFASGCFWCMEATFESVKGVKEAVSGYSGGTEANPTYEEVGSGSTGHAESVEVYYDPKEVSYETLLNVYLGSMDPTQVNGQGPDHGKQYRSIIFYRNNGEQVAARNAIQQLESSGEYKAPISIAVVPFVKFWKAEDYHQDYVEKNPTQGYVVGESIPRIKRFQAKFPDLIKAGHKF